MKEVPQVKMIDKLSFTFGVLCICGSEWLALRHADWFPLYYTAIMAVLLLWRLITYTKDKFQLFMLDFCYFVNLSVVLQTFFFMSNIDWFKVSLPVIVFKRKLLSTIIIRILCWFILYHL